MARQDVFQRMRQARVTRCVAALVPFALPVCAKKQQRPAVAAGIDEHALDEGERVVIGPLGIVEKERHGHVTHAWCGRIQHRFEEATQLLRQFLAPSKDLTGNATRGPWQHAALGA